MTTTLMVRSDSSLCRAHSGHHHPLSLHGKIDNRSSSRKSSMGWDMEEEREGVVVVVLRVVLVGDGSGGGDGGSSGSSAPIR